MEREYCEECNGPVMARSRLELVLSHIAYHVWMMLPYWIALRGPGMAILPYVGNIAFGCTCWDKNKRARTPIQEQQP